KQEVAYPCAEEADPIMRGHRAGCRVQGGVVGRIGAQRHDEQKRDENQRQPQKRVQGPDPRGRHNEVKGLHGGSAPAQANSASEMQERTENLRADSIIPVPRGESWAKLGGGTLVATPVGLSRKNSA